MINMKKIIFMLLAATLFIACDKDMPFDPNDTEQDVFEGAAKELYFTVSTENLVATEGVCVLKGPNGLIFKRNFTHIRENGESKITLDKGLRDGKYTLLYFKVDQIDGERSAAEEEVDDKESYGMGCKFSVSGTTTTVESTYNEDFGMYGSGSETDPFTVSSYSHLLNLAELANDANTNCMLDSTYHYAQECDIDMDFASWRVADGYGWNPIGCSNLTPFRGHYHGKGQKITNLWSERNNSSFVALFGCVTNTRIDSLSIESARIEGWFSSAALVGCALTRSGCQDVTYISNCKVENSSIFGNGSSSPTDNSLAIGGLVGTVEEYAQLYIDRCEIASSNQIVGGYAVGGVLGAGALMSKAIISNCVNNANITSYYAPCGGIVGSADSLFIVGCTNNGNIQANYGGTEGEATTVIGAGGIVGGLGASHILSCVNYGNIQGQEGVAGIVGSSRVSSGEDSEEGYSYNDIMVYNCENLGSIQGVKFVGGLVGESQCTIYSSLNSGSVRGEDYVGGIIGESPICAVQNTINQASVEGVNQVGGIVGNSIMGAITCTQNYADVNATGNHIGGIVGLSGTYFIAHYCTNTGSVSTTMSEASVGGIAGEIGDPKMWTMRDTFRIVVSVATTGFGILNASSAIKYAALLVRSSDYNRFVVDYDLTLAKQGNINDENLSTLMQPVKSFMSDAEYNAYINSMSTQSDQTISAVQSKLQTIRAEHEIYGGFNQYYQDVLTYSTDESSKEQFFQNMNDMLNERADDVAGWEKQDEIIHSAVGCACMIVGGVCFISSLALTAGSSALVIAKVLATVSCTTAVANNVTRACTDFEENTVVVSQCVNTGTLQCGTESSISGLVGQLNEYGIISECLNTGAIVDANNRNAAQLTTELRKKSIVEDCLLAGGKSWNYLDILSAKSSAEVSGIYYWTDGFIPSVYSMYSIPIVYGDDLANPDIYTELSMGANGDHWIMSQYGDLTLPVPYKSRFME